MADRSFLTPAEVIHQMVEDLENVASIPAEQLNRLGELLQQQTGFLTAESLAKLVSECIADEDQGAAPCSALRNLPPDDIRQVDEIRDLEWIQSPEQILQQLENAATPQEDRRTAVLFAETTEFPADSIPRLLNVLSQFIGENRLTTDAEMATAVGSAIRKYAMNMSEEQFDSYANWLLPSQTETLGHKLELELTKAIEWRLMYEPVSAPGEHPVLLRVLSDLCSGYLTPRLILQKNYAATVLHGIVAVAILKAIAGIDSQTDELIGSAINMRVEWFTEVLADRLAESIETISEHSPKLADRLRIQTDNSFDRWGNQQPCQRGL